MGWLMRWNQGCEHVADEWRPQQFQRGNDDRWYEYAIAKCVHCGRPLVSFAPDFPAEERTPTRRHVAWTYLDKEGEHAANTHVLDWVQA